MTAIFISPQPVKTPPNVNKPREIPNGHPCNVVEARHKKREISLFIQALIQVKLETPCEKQTD